MEYRKLYLDDIELFKIFYQDNPIDEDEGDLEDNIEEIEDELRINKFKYFGFIQDGKLLGYAKFRVEEDQAHLIGPFILPEYRRKGLGREIIQKIENYCTYEKLSRLNAYSFIDEKLADTFLTSIGYKREPVNELGINLYVKEF